MIEKLSKQAPNATHYVIFDACRNELNLSGPAAKAIGAEMGFVPVAQTPGLLIAYATAQGKTAADMGDNGGPYARAPAAELVKPGIEAVSMFRNVQIRVREAIGQDPRLSFPALPTVYLAGRPEEKSTTSPMPNPAVTTSTPTYEQQAELTYWSTVKDSKDPAVLQAYLDKYSRGTFADLARQLIAQAKRESEARQAEAAERTAQAQRAEAERKARDAEAGRRQDQLRQALEEARQAREALKAAKADRLAAEKAAEEARRSAEQLAGADLARARVEELRKQPAAAEANATISAFVKLCGPASTLISLGHETGDGCFTYHEQIDGSSLAIVVSVAVRHLKGSSHDSFLVRVPPDVRQQVGARIVFYPKDAWEKKTERGLMRRTLRLLH